MTMRASPVVLRKALELAHLYVKMGINFVAVPVTTEEEQAELAARSMDKLAEMEKESEE